MVHCGTLSSSSSHGKTSPGGCGTPIVWLKLATGGVLAAALAPRPHLAGLGLLAAVACLVGTLLLAYPALGGAFLVNPMSDQYIAGYAFREFGASMLRQTGSVPLWNPYLFGGMPFVAAMHGDIFYPTALLRLLLPTDAGLTWGFILHIFLAGCFTYGFLRACGFSFFPALVAGVIAGEAIHGRLLERPFRWFVASLLGVVGALLLARSLSPG